jgi:hypothetical protein
MPLLEGSMNSLTDENWSAFAKLIKPARTGLVGLAKTDQFEFEFSKI